MIGTVQYHVHNLKPTQNIPYLLVNIYSNQKYF